MNCLFLYNTEFTFLIRIAKISIQKNFIDEFTCTKNVSITMKKKYFIFLITFFSTQNSCAECF